MIKGQRKCKYKFFSDFPQSMYVSCLVLFNHVSSGVHFSGADPHFSGKIDPAPSKNGPYAYDKYDVIHKTGST